MLLSFYWISTWFCPRLFPLEFPSFNFCLDSIVYIFSFLSLFPSFNVLLPLTLPNSALPEHFFFFYFCWCFFQLLGMCRLFVSIYSFLLPRHLQIFCGFLCPSFLVLFPSTSSLVQGCPFLVPLFLQVLVLGTLRHEALSSTVWFSVLLALRRAGLCCLCGAWSALRAKRGGDGTFGELNFWNGSLLTVGRGSQFDFSVCCLGLTSKLLLKDIFAL